MYTIYNYNYIIFLKDGDPPPPPPPIRKFFNIQYIKTLSEHMYIVTLC